MIWLALYLLAAISNAWWLRNRWAWAQRANDCNWQAWVLLDIVAAFCLFWPPYIGNVIKDRPPPGITISAFVGWQASKKRRWALVAARIIDLPFFILLSQSDHCAKEYAKWADPLGRMGARGARRAAVLVRAMAAAPRQVGAGRFVIRMK